MPKDISQHHETLIYQWNNWEILLREDKNLETIWANLDQISALFGRNKSTISRHIRGIFDSEELVPEQTVAKNATVQKEWNNMVQRNIEYYNLDMILSVWYRVNSKQATEFRKWSNSILKSYITQWVAINTSLLQENTDKFQKALEYLSNLSAENIQKLESGEILSLIKSYASTWLSLDAFDKQSFPEDGLTHSEISISADELSTSIQSLKTELIAKWEATNLFAHEKTPWSISGIVWNVFQTFGWEDVYPSLEEKSANLLYFIVKNHVFTDGNKRSWALSFVWFLQKSQYPHLSRISPETLTTLTLLIAESNPKEKEKIIGLILLLLK